MNQPSLIAIILSLTFSPLALAKRINPKAGQFECTSDAKTLELEVSGYCIYQAFPNGDAVFSDLLKLAQDQTKRWVNGGFNPNVIEPTKAPGAFRIRWWLSTMESNQALGKLLQDNDHPYQIFTLPKVVLSASMYSFEKGKERELGLQIGAFYKDLPKGGIDSKQNSLEALVSGLFKLSGSIGNPMASYLNLGINASMASNTSSKVQEVTWECTIGTYCEYNHSSTHYYNSPISVEKEKLGIRIAARPNIDPSQPGLVKLDDLSFTYATKTKDKEAPVDIITPYNGRDLILNTSELYVIGSEVSRYDIRNGDLLDFSKSSGHTQFLIMISATVQDPGQKNGPIKQFSFKSDNRSYSREEISNLSNGKYSLYDTLSSLEKVCFIDRINPSNNEPVCGFQLKKIDQRTMNYRLHIRVKGNLESGKSQDVYWKVSEIAKKKGYFQLPPMNTSGPGRFTVTIEMDDSNPAAKAVRSREKIKGIKFDYGYYPGKDDPIEFNPGSIQPYNGSFFGN